MKRMKTGTWTAWFILAAAALSITAAWFGLDSLYWLARGWPVLLVVLGLEIWAAPDQNGQSKVRIAWGRILASVAVSLLAVVAFQGWLYWNGVQQGQGKSMTLEPIRLALSSSTGQFVLENDNGNAEFLAEDRDDVEVTAEIRFPFLPPRYTGPVADDVRVEVYEKNRTLYVETESEVYRIGFFRIRPTVNLTVRVPLTHELDYEIRQENGAVIAQSLPLKDTFEAGTTNGRIEVGNMRGSFELRTTNGLIAARSIRGRLEARTTNGNIRAGWSGRRAGSPHDERLHRSRKQHNRG